jgi:hypothetical protein
VDLTPARDTAPTAFGAAEDLAGLSKVAAALGRDAVHVALFAGAGEDAGEVALSAARLAAAAGERVILLDVGVRPSRALGRDAEGLGELLSGEAAFGDVIVLDESSRVHIIPFGRATSDPPLQRLSLAVGALSHTYDKVIVVAHRLADWPADCVRPDLAAIVCGSGVPERRRRALYDETIARGARSALVVRRTNADEATFDGAEAV